MIRVHLTYKSFSDVEKSLPLLYVDLDANGWVMGQQGELSVLKKDPQTGFSEDIAMFSPGQWAYLQDNDPAKPPEPPNG